MAAESNEGSIRTGDSGGGSYPACGLPRTRITHARNLRGGPRRFTSRVAHEIFEELLLLRVHRGGAPQVSFWTRAACVLACSIEYNNKGFYRTRTRTNTIPYDTRADAAG